MSTVKIGNKQSLAQDSPATSSPKIGINHNGDIDLAKRLISVAVAAGCDAVKFQKRTVDVVYTAAELATPRPNPFGDTNGDLKRGPRVWRRRLCRDRPLLQVRQDRLVRLAVGRGFRRLRTDVQSPGLQDRVGIADRRSSS